MKNKLLYISAFVVGLTLPISIKLGNVALFIFMGLSLFKYFSEDKIVGQKNKLFIILSTVPLLLLCVISLIYSMSLESSINTIGRRSSFLLLPLIFILIKVDTLRKIRKYAIIGLTAGCFTGGMFLLSNVLHIYFSNKQSFTIGFDLLNYYHTYHNFTAPLKIHPTYLGSYFLISIAYCISKIMELNKLKTNFYYILFIGFFVIIEFFINSRVILFLLFLLLAVVTGYFMYNLFRKNKLIFIFSIVFLFSMSYLAFTAIKQTYIFYRFSEELVWESSVEKNTKINEDNGGDSRLARWSSILKVIKNKSAFGYGAGTEKTILEPQFKRDGLFFSLENKYDSHNQYLSYGVQFGTFGLLVFLIFIVGNIFISIRSRDLIYITLSISLSIICLFENYLNTNAGIIFIAFWSNLLLISSLRKYV